MASSISHPSPFLSSSTPLSINRKTRHHVYRSRASVFAAKGQNHMVDENMIVLRKRIREMKMEERSYEPPCEWLDWEKINYVSYNAYVCEAMRVLQSELMNTRPSLVIGMMVLIALSVPVSTFVVASNALQIAIGALNGIL